MIGSMKNDINIDFKSKEVFCNLNHILAVFGNSSYKVKYKLFKSFCMPLYGCVLWDYTSKNIERILTSWRKCIRKLLSVTNRTHCQLLPLLVDDIPVESQLYKRVLKFVAGLLCSKNVYNNLCVKLALNGSGSKMCKNINLICNKYEICRYNLGKDYLKQNLCIVNSTSVDKVDSNSFRLSRIVQDMLIMKEEQNFQFFTKSEIDTIIESICVSNYVTGDVATLLPRDIFMRKYEND